MHKIIAFARRDLLVAASYRTGMVMSVLGLLVVIVPAYFIAGALQPVAAPVIGDEGGDYFAFLIAGMATYQFVATAISTVPVSLGSGLRTGTFEFLMTTPTRLHTILGGMLAYPFLWSVLRATALLSTAALLGAQFGFDRLVMAILIWALIVLAYVPFGLLASAMVLLTRTAGPLPTAVLAVSTFLGGVYYPTHVIPSWLGDISAIVPLTYGLRALRRVMIDDRALAEVWPDLKILLALTAGLLAVGVVAVVAAFRHARRAGSLGQY